MWDLRIGRTVSCHLYSLVELTLGGACLAKAAETSHLAVREVSVVHD